MKKIYGMKLKKLKQTLGFANPKEGNPKPKPKPRATNPNVPDRLPHEAEPEPDVALMALETMTLESEIYIDTIEVLDQKA